MHDLSLHIEAILFTAEEPVRPAEVAKALAKSGVVPDEVSATSVRDALDALETKYRTGDFAFELTRTGGGYRLLTRRDYYKTVSAFLHETSRKRLSSAALETLSIIAYKQPVTKSEVEAVRGVSCDYTIHKLMEKELVTMLGKAEGPGRPILYGVSQFFLDYFGIDSTGDLPKLRDIEQPENAVGEATVDEEASALPSDAASAPGDPSEPA